MASTRFRQRPQIVSAARCLRYFHNVLLTALLQHAQHALLQHAQHALLPTAFLLTALEPTELLLNALLHALLPVALLPTALLLTAFLPTALLPTTHVAFTGAAGFIAVTSQVLLSYVGTLFFELYCSQALLFSCLERCSRPFVVLCRRLLPNQKPPPSGSLSMINGVLILIPEEIPFP